MHRKQIKHSSRWNTFAKPSTRRLLELLKEITQNQKNKQLEEKYEKCRIQIYVMQRRAMNNINKSSLHFSIIIQSHTYSAIAEHSFWLNVHSISDCLSRFVSAYNCALCASISFKNCCSLLKYVTHIHWLANDELIFLVKMKTNGENNKKRERERNRRDKMYTVEKPL